MNKELEKLIDYAITDGFITEKEKKVLIKKAEKQGFDIDELEMILEGKLFDAFILFSIVSICRADPELQGRS